MRAALWLIALFGIAVGAAIFAGENHGTVTVFWSPYRIDLSVNLVVIALVAGFVLLHLALRALSALFDLPRQARRWRNQQKERAMHSSMLDVLSHLIAGRFIRARRSAEIVLAQEESLRMSGEKLPNASQLRALANLLASESAQALQDKPARDEHLRLAMHETAQNNSAIDVATREGTQLRAAKWALEDHDAGAALARLDELPQGAARRTVALRLRLQASRLARRTKEAMDDARLLAKHRAFSADAASSLIRGLATELINNAHDMTQLNAAWASLEPAERLMPDLAVHAANRLAILGGDASLARAWLLPMWEKMISSPTSLNDSQKVKLIGALELGMDSIDAAWLSRIEAAQLGNFRDANLQYLAGTACMSRHLWGKAQQLLNQSMLGLKDSTLRRKAWRSLAKLAEERGDMEAAATCWKNAALE